MQRLARSLFCAALVNEAAGEPEASGWRFLEAAWACDDEDERSGTAAIAAFVRSLAAEGDDQGRNCAEAFAGEE